MIEQNDGESSENETRLDDKKRTLFGHMIRSVRDLTDDDFQAAAKLIRRVPRVRGGLTNVLGQPPVPPILKSAVVRTDDRAWRVGMAFAEAVEVELSRRIAFTRGGSLTLEALLESLRWIEQALGTATARLWLAGYAYSAIEQRDSLLILRFLISGSPWSCEALASHHPDLSKADVVSEIAELSQDDSNQPVHRGWKLAVQDWFTLTHRVHDDFTNDDRELVRWMFGAVELSEDHVSTWQSDVSDLLDPPRDYSALDLDVENLPEIVARLLEDAREATERANSSINGGFEPDLDTVATLWRLLAAGRQLRTAADVRERGIPLVELAQTICATKTSPLLVKLAAVEATSGADEVAIALRDAAARAIDTGQHADALTQLAELIGSDSTPTFEDLHPLLNGVPDALHAAVLAASTGALRLPDLPAAGQAVDDRIEILGVGDRSVDDDTSVHTVTEPSRHGDQDTTAFETKIAARGADRESVDRVDPATSSVEAEEVSPATGEDVGVEATPRTQVEQDVGQDETVLDAQVPASGLTLSETLQGVDDETSIIHEPDRSDVRRLLVSVLGDSSLTTEHRTASAYWILRATDGDECQETAFEILSYATAMRRDGGPAGVAFDHATTRLPIEVLIDSRTARILTIAAALRAALVAPWSSHRFLHAIASHYDSQPGLRAIIDATLQAALQGVQVGAAAPTDFHTGFGVDERVDELSARATELLEVGPERNLGYQAATRVWQRWIARDNGWLGQMLATVADHNSSRIGEVRNELARLDRRELVDRISITDREQRGHRAVEIEYHGRDTLLRRTQTHLDLVADWIDAVESRQAAEKVDASYSDRVVAQLRATVAQRREAAFAELADTGSDELASSAALLSTDILGDLFKRLDEGRPYTGREPDPAARMLARPLLATDIALDTETWQSAGVIEFDQLEVLATPLSYADAFARRLDRLDLDEAAAIASVATYEGTDRANEEFQQQLHEATIAAQQRAAEMWADARTELTVAKREGYLDATTATVFDQRLDELDLADSSGRFTDTGRALRKLKALRSDIKAAKDEQIALRRAEALALADDHDDVAAMLKPILGLIDRGLLVAAEERLNQAIAGVRPPEQATPVWTGTSMAQAFEAATELDAETLAAVRGGSTWTGLDFSALEGANRNRAAHAAEAWIALAARQTNGQTRRVAEILRALRLDLPNEAVSIPGGRPVGRHQWFSVTGAAARGAPVPQFGSLSNGRFRILVTWTGTSPEQAGEIIENDSFNVGSIIHLHLGAWNLSQRHAYAETLRARHLGEVLPIDSVVFTCRMTLSEESWAATCALALPYTATNPYMIDAAGGLLPTEMFFGRTEEVRSLLTPTGPTIVYGGRQLGKTALLKQVAARHGYESVAAYLDIKTIGQDGNTDLVWGKIRNELDRAGLPLPDARNHKVEDSVTAGVRRWLDDDHSRRLLILLDEADYFLAADREDSFAQVHKLKSFMDSTDRRCKVIFAGLHQVGRFQRDPNHPFAHLGRPIAVGGLDPQDAHNLLAQPLTALGYVPVDSDVLQRAATYANYHPAILQRFGHHLAVRLRAGGQAGPPPWVITHDDVQGVFNDPDFAAWVAGLVDWTLQLDRRYAVLAYTMAVLEHERGEARPLTVQEIMNACAEHDAPEFAQAGREDEIVALLDELVHLGVLRQPSGGRWQLRSRYISRMLGSEEEILQRLVKAVDDAKSTWQEFDPAAHRRPFEGSRERIFPLTDRQLETFCAPHPSYRILVGSKALGIDDVRDALHEATAPTPTTKVYQRRPTRRGGTRPPDSSENLHRVVVADVRDTAPAQARRAIEQAMAWATDPTVIGSVSTLVLLDARRIDVLRSLLDERLVTLGNAPALTSLHRMDVHGVELWARTAEADVGGSNAAQAVIDATGGWPWLVAHAAQHSVETNQMLSTAAEHIAAELTKPESAQAFIEATGVGLIDGPALVAWQLITAYGRVSATEFEHELAKELGGKHMRQIAIRERRLLELLGVLDINDDTIAPEPVLTEAWTRSTQDISS